MTSYDEVAYPSRPLAQTQPDRLVTQAVLHGIRSPDVATARVLEVGCSDAGNLAWLAAYAPDSRFLGVDMSEAAVARAQATVVGLANAEVRQADLRELDAGEFDVVIAHGVYSWLPDPGALLACVDRHLAPDGIAYVSYNTMPGAHVRAMVGDPMRRFTGARPDRLPAARALLEWIAASQVESEHAELARRAAALSLSKPDHLLIHDEMADENHAVYFDEFVADAAAHGLAYLGESHLADSQPPPGLTPPPPLGAEVTDDEVALQQVYDYIRNRAFRATLLVRAGNAPGTHVIDPSRLDRLWAAAPARRGARVSGRTTWALLGEVTLTTDSRELGADLDRLGASWPASVPVADLAADRSLLLRAHRGRGLELRAGPVPAVLPGDRPAVVGHARTRARADGELASARHDLLRLEDALTREAVALCDGATSRAVIATRLATRADAPPNTRAALDQLLDELGRASLFIA